MEHLQCEVALRRTLAALALALLLPFIVVNGVRAQDAAPGTGDVTQNDVNAVARELWCPLCSGVRLDACELKACDQMKDVIEIKLGEGETVQSIKSYFVQQYGPQVLGEPPLQGFNWLAWILPVVVLVGGGVFLYTRARRIGHTAAVAAPREASVTSAAIDAEYARRLEEELKQHE